VVFFFFFKSSCLLFVLERTLVFFSCACSDQPLKLCVPLKYWFLNFFFFFLHKELNFGCFHLLQGAPGPWCELLRKTILAFVEVSSIQGSSFAISWVSSLELSCCGKLKSQNHHIICHL
jgi:hypothetical protein